MSARSATRLAWWLWVACLALIALAVLLDFLRTDMFVSHHWQIRIHDRDLYAESGGPQGLRTGRRAGDRQRTSPCQSRLTDP
jgi:hypothetical protein